MKTQPSSLPLSERLRFFSSLSETNKRNSYSFTRSPPFNSIERSSSMGSYHYYMANATPRSSTSLSSASVTPTPMECPLPIFIESPSILHKGDSSASPLTEAATEAAGTQQDLTDSRFTIKPDIVKTSPFLQNAHLAHLAEPETTPTSALTPTMKRIKLKTIGKLMLPTTFLNNDRNNNSKEGNSFSCNESLNCSENGENAGPPKKIGKIKSPFIENCNQKQQKHMQHHTAKATKFDYITKTPNSQVMALSSLENSAERHSLDGNVLSGSGAIRKYLNNSMQTNSHHQHHHQYQQQQNNEDLNTDSGKENVDTSLKEQTTPVVEIRRKFTRKANTSQSFNNSVSGHGISRHSTPRSASLNGPYSSPQVDDKYAKYFGVKSATKSSSSSSAALPAKQHTPATPVQDFGRPYDHTPQLQAVNQNVRLWQSTGRGIKRTASVIQELKKFEDIVVTEKELNLASKEFDNLLNDSILKHSPTELDRIFSSIV